VTAPEHDPAPFEPRVVTEPGVYDMSPEAYHADPVPGGSLSHSGARKLMPPSCPALFRYWADHGQPPKREFDFGHAAHQQVLGAGQPVTVVDAENWRTKAAKEKADAAREAGSTPVLAHEWEIVEAMAAKIREHPIASALFNPDTGRGEQALVWVDERTGVWRRALIDWLPNPVRGQRLVIGDYKTCRCAAPSALPRTMADYGYNSQADWYLAAIKALGLHGGIEPAFVNVFQEKTPPYLVTVGWPDPTALLWGARHNAEALDTYRACLQSGRWPGYADDVITVSLPPWTVRNLEDEWMADAPNPEGIAS
jgi:hypothetical protein